MRKASSRRPHSFQPYDRNLLFLDELRHFLACLAGEQTPVVSVRAGAQSLRMVLAAGESLATGNVIQLDMSQGPSSFIVLHEEYEHEAERCYMATKRNDTQVFAKETEEELRLLLAESAVAASARAQQTFDTLAAPDGTVLVLFGCGGLGRKTLAGLPRALGIEPDVFADNNAALWGKEVEGVPVLAPQEAVQRFGATAVFVVTIWRAGGTHRFGQTRQQLSALGCTRVAAFGVISPGNIRRPFLPTTVWISHKRCSHRPRPCKLALTFGLTIIPAGSMSIKCAGASGLTMMASRRR